MDTTTLLAIATVVQAFATVVLVAVTVYYVVETRRIVQEAKDSRELAAAPVVRCNLAPQTVASQATRPVAGSSLKETVSAEEELIRLARGVLSRHVFYLSNIGDGTALNIAWRMDAEAGDRGLFMFQQREGVLDALPPGDDPGHPILLEAEVDEMIGSERSSPLVTISISIAYSNIFERAFTTHARFALEISSFRDRQYKWEKLDQYIAIDRKERGRRRWLR